MLELKPQGGLYTQYYYMLTDSIYHVQHILGYTFY